MVTKFAKFHFIKLLLIFICRRVFEVQKFVELRKLHDEPKLDENKINTHIYRNEKKIMKKTKMLKILTNIIDKISSNLI